MGWYRADGGVGSLSHTQAAHMEVDRHLELAADAVVLSACGVIGDHTLQAQKRGKLVLTERRHNRGSLYRKDAQHGFQRLCAEDG